MFGGIAVLPLYLQIVKGAVARPQAGLLMLPMVARHHGRLDRRPARSSRAPAATGSSRSSAPRCWWSRCSCSHSSAPTPPLWQTMIVMVVFGLGLGFNMQPLMLAVQNAVAAARHRRRHLARRRSSGRSAAPSGTAVFLSILFSAVPDRRSPTAFARVAPTPDFQAALQTPQGDAGRQPGLHRGAAERAQPAAAAARSTAP